MTPPLIAGLLQPAAYPRGASAPRLIETHISWVILAGDYAYKLKKPVNFGFLDFSSLDKRLFCCREEIRLNRRLAPDIYLDVVPVTGSEAAPRIGGDGPVLEWAVQMRAFPADATLDREKEVSAEQIDAIAERIARFHGEIAAAAAETEFGQPEKVRAPVHENFAQLRPLLPAPALPRLDHLEHWSRREGERRVPHFAARRAAGFVRECHGDLHLGNIAWVDNAPLIFDGIEFNPSLRYIDVISEIAFLTMDLTHRGLEPLAWRCLNRYLEHTGDSAGLAALRYYQVYRAMVRAKVAALRATGGTTQGEADFDECLSYLGLAEHLARPRKPVLLLMHGVSGSGKTWLSQQLLERLGTLRLRSDVERKRLFGLGPLDPSAGVPGGIYTREAGARTLQSLLDQSRSLLACGYPVIVDATFISRNWRAPFHALADELGVPWRIVAVEATPEVLRARLARRQTEARDASEAGLDVLDAQLDALEPFSGEETPHILKLTGNWHLDDAIAGLRDLLP